VDGPSVYGYAGGSPGQYVDPDGLVRGARRTLSGIPPVPGRIQYNPDALEYPLRGGAGPVRQGQRGEQAVRQQCDIGNPTGFTTTNGRNRRNDGENTTSVTEIKNVQVQSLTQQIRDLHAYAQSQGKTLDLYFTRPDYRITRPLSDYIRNNPTTIRQNPNFGPE